MTQFGVAQWRLRGALRPCVEWLVGQILARIDVKIMEIKKGDNDQPALFLDVIGDLDYSKTAGRFSRMCQERGVSEALQSLASCAIQSGAYGNDSLRHELVAPRMQQVWDVAARNICTTLGTLFWDLESCAGGAWSGVVDAALEQTVFDVVETVITGGEFAQQDFDDEGDSDSFYESESESDDDDEEDDEEEEEEDEDESVNDE